MQRRNNCPWCVHTRAMVWEQRIWQGENVETVAADTPFSLHAAHLHVRDHMGLVLSAEPLITSVPSVSQAAPIPAAPAPDASSSTGSAPSVAAYAADLLKLASQVVAAADVAAEHGSLESAMREIEIRALALDEVAASLGVDIHEAEQMLNEVTATVRGALRAGAAGLGNDLEFLAVAIREEGGHRVANDLEQRIRARQRA